MITLTESLNLALNEGLDPNEVRVKKNEVIDKLRNDNAYYVMARTPEGEHKFMPNVNIVFNDGWDVYVDGKKSFSIKDSSDIKTLSDLQAAIQYSKEAERAKFDIISGTFGSGHMEFNSGRGRFANTVIIGKKD